MPSVVIADDEEFVRYLLNSVMESMSFDVVAEVEKGDDLLSVMSNKQPNMLLLDVNMPNMTGIEFLKEHSCKFPKTCVIILTSAALATLRDEASSAGARCFLRKDTPLDQMVYAIKETWTKFAKESH